MEYKTTLETKISKAGKPYDVLVIHLTDTYTKEVFLEKAELELLKLQNTNTKGKNLDFLK